MCADEFAEERKRAEVFDALSHPTRILILKALNENPAGFADLKKQLGIDSSGHLQHHISKLNSLVKTDENGKYALSDEGKDALNSVETVEKVTESGTKHKPKTATTKTSNILKLASLVLVALLVSSCSVAIYQHNLMSVLQNEQSEQDGIISGLNSKVDELNTTICQQNEKVSRLTSDLDVAKSVIKIEKPAQSRYLTTEEPKANMTKIFLESTDVWFNGVESNHPFSLIQVMVDKMTQRYNVSLSFVKVSTWSTTNGYFWYSDNLDEPVLMIGVTLRNDYELGVGENFTDPTGNSSETNNGDSLSLPFIKLNVKLYDKDGNVIEAEQTKFGVPLPYGHQETVLTNNDESTQHIFYLSPSNWDIDHYEIFADYVAASPQSTD